MDHNIKGPLGVMMNDESHEFDPSSYIMNRLGPQLVMVEKFSPLKCAVCHRRRSAREAEGTFLERKASTQIEPEQNKNPLDSLRLNFGNGTRGQWSARMTRSARG